MVDNDDGVRTLERVLLEIRGENSFKVRAHRMAAARVESPSQPLTSAPGRRTRGSQAAQSAQGRQR